jgi:hypothetical protein
MDWLPVIGAGLVEILLVINLTGMMVLSGIGFLWAIRELRALHFSLDRRLDELVVATRLMAHAAGVAEERARHDDPER